MPKNNIFLIHALNLSPCFKILISVDFPTLLSRFWKKTNWTPVQKATVVRQFAPDKRFNTMLKPFYKQWLIGPDTIHQRLICR